MLTVLYHDRSDSGTPRVTEALRAALAGVNAKLSELKSENSVLQNASSRARELSRKHKALQDVRDPFHYLLLTFY